ncbi:hypothetical protein GECvBMG_gp238c [Salmonella phage GEC_vB_MG]|nr:hypothetical protein GECvBMG_gp238c [Salmonella phage GEC_vB_MG]
MKRVTIVSLVTTFTFSIFFTRRCCLSPYIVHDPRQDATSIKEKLF